MSQEEISVGRWILRTTRSTGGDLYEMEDRVRFEIYDQKSRIIALSFRGTEDFDYDSPGWSHVGSSGIKSIELEEDHARVTDHTGKTTRHRLPPRTLNNNDIDRILEVFITFQASVKTYLDTREWSSEVAKPKETIEASEAEVWRQWALLREILTALNLSDAHYHDLIWPKRIRGGRAKIAALRPWLEANRHLSETPISTFQS